MEVKTKIGSSFLKLVKKHFTSDHPLHKILNHRSLKLSYSCLPNVKNMISSHNKKLLTKPTNLSSQTCNCNNKQDCPLEGKCLQSNLIYQANITTETGTVNERIYIGSAGNTFKERFRNHKTSFSRKEKKNSTEL